MSSFYASYPPSGGGGGGGTVTSVDVSGGTTGLTTSGGPITTTGTITIAGLLNVGHGGTGVVALGNFTDAGTDGIVVTGGTGAVITSMSIAQHVADASHNGYLSSTDWSTFNSKQAALTIGNLTDAGTDGIVVTGGTGSIIGSGVSLAQHVADASHNGYLSSTDWSTFNGKGAGSVTSVAMTVPAFLSISGSPVTTSGTLAVSLSGTALPVANGGTAVTSVTVAPAATTFAGWDANKNLSANSLIDGYTTTATAAGTTTLVVGSTKSQYFTGSTTQTVVLPVTSTLVLGQQFRVANASTGIVTVQSSGANNIQAQDPNSVAMYTCILTSGTTAASWSVNYEISLAAGPLPVANGGTGATALTLGSVVFAGASGVYTQDNARFFWDNTNHRLGINTASPASSIDVTGGVNVTGNTASATITTTSLGVTGGSGGIAITGSGSATSGSGNKQGFSYSYSFAPASGSANAVAMQLNPIINGVSSGTAVGLAIASRTNTLTGGLVRLIDIGTTSTDYFTGYTSRFMIDSAGLVGIAATPANLLSVNALTFANSLAQVAISTAALGNVGMTIQGVASQSGDLQQWQTSGGTVLSKVVASGKIVGRDFQAFSGTNAFYNAGGTGWVNYDGSAGSFPGNQLVAAAAGTVVVAVTGASSQSVNLQEWRNSSAAVLGYVDQRGNITGNNLAAAYATTATAAGTTTLTVSSTGQQFFTGTTTQTVVLPVTSTLTLGFQYQITNQSTGVVTVQSSGANTVQAMAANTIAVYTCILTSGTTAASWSVRYWGISGGTYIESVAGNTNIPGASNAYGDATSLTLSVGDWDLCADLVLLKSSATFTSVQAIAGITSTSGNSATGLNTGQNAFEYDFGGNLLTFNRLPFMVAAVRATSDGTNTVINGTSVATQIVYLKLLVSAFTGGPPSCVCRLSARKIT